MRNNFSYILNKTFYDNLENTIYSLMFLPTNDFHDIFDMRKSLKIKISSENIKNIGQISDIALDLINSYLCLDMKKLPSLPVLTSDSKKFFNMLNLNTYFSDDMYKTISGDSFDDFLDKNSVKNPIYKQELKNLMILSYLYTSSMGKNYKKNDENLLLYFYQRILGNETMQPYDDKFETRKIYDKINTFKSVATPAMMSFWGKKDKIGTKYTSYDISSKYDIEILLLLTNSTNKTRNPYVLFTKKNEHAAKQSKRYCLVNKLTNIKLFLEDLSKISLNPNSSKNILEYLPSEENNYNDRKALCIYNQYILERLTNINFINKLYSIKKAKNLSNEDILSILPFISSPMLQSRLTMLDYLEHSNFFSSKDFSQDKQSFLQNVFTHQIMCVVPIATLTFNYLMSLLPPEKRHSYLQEYLENYSYDNKFFDYDKEQPIILPQQATFSNLNIDTNNNDYREFLNTCYSKFFMYTNYYDSHNFDNQLFKHMQKRYLYTIKDLFSINIPVDENNPEGIVTGTLPPNNIFSK